jgi:hypothetical protein
VSEAIQVTVTPTEMMDDDSMGDNESMNDDSMSDNESMDDEG